MPEDIRETLEEYRKQPWRLVKVACAIAEDGLEPPKELESLFTGDDKPVIKDLTSASAPLWDLLALPERDKGLRWLDDAGLLHILFPCWAGNASRRKLRLNAVEQIHLETWKDGLSDGVMQLINDTMDEVVDGRINRWALTALGTMLAGGDTENQYFWSKMVRRNMYELGATEAEIVWVENIVIDYRRAIHFLRGEQEDFTLTPELAVVILSTMIIGGEDSKADIANSAKRADEALQEKVSSL